MNALFTINVSKDRTHVTLSLKNEEALNNVTLTPKVLNDWLQTKEIVFGIDQQVIKEICEMPKAIRYPIEIAKGIPSENGQDAYLVNEVMKDNELSTDMDKDEQRQFNFRNIRTIPSVQSGQLLATINPPTAGTTGKDVYGNVLKPRPGKQLRLRPGKNIIFKDNKIFATTAGQISISSNSVNVFPVFEVKGDLDLKTGNINFVGNVVIYGNVPSGYEIKAGGDVKIRGLVEASSIDAAGSIHITGGIAGQKKAILNAGVDLHTRYINQATVTAGNDIQVDTFIMHSEVSAVGGVKCTHIIGGSISAGNYIEANEIGNQHFAKTDLYIGNQSDLIQYERTTLEEIKKMKDGLTKLTMLKERLEEKKQTTGSLSSVEEQMMKKQQETAIAFIQKLEVLESELEEIRLQMEENEQGYLIIRDKIYPNNLVHFSKYTKVIEKPYSFIKLYLEQGEIISAPL